MICVVSERVKSPNRKQHPAGDIKFPLKKKTHRIFSKHELTLETNFGSISASPRERLLDGAATARSAPELETAAMTNALLH